MITVYAEKGFFSIVFLKSFKGFQQNLIYGILSKFPILSSTQSGEWQCNRGEELSMGQKDYEKRVDKMENLPHNKTYVAKRMF